MKKKTKTTIWRPIATTLAAFAVLASLLQPIDDARAANAAEFDPAYIISDEQFYDGNAMTEGEIAAFLQNQIGSCLNANCLNVIRTNTTTRPADAMCASYRGEANESAARILFKVQAACGISARVLLVTLQKEQSLVTHRQPTLGRIDRAMGYACPDDTTRPGWCDPAFAGLYNQLYRAAWQLKRYGNPPGTSNYFTWFPVGRATAILYNPNRACGTQSVTIANKATAALYYYTPYTPNRAALDNLYGIGDGCSAYGNRNFWRFYTDWFGSPTGPFMPYGNVESVTGSMGELRVRGWAHDPNTRASIEVHAYVDGVGVARRADIPRADVPALNPTAGPAHGFDFSISATPGTRSVCLYAINTGPGQNVLLGCRNVFVDGVTELGRAPFGSLDGVTAAPGSVSVRGWAIDPDTAAAIDVHVYVDAQGRGVRAAEARADVGAAHPAYGASRGYSATIPAAPGPRRVCAYAINSGPGSNSLLGCRTVQVPSAAPANTPPRGSLDTVVRTSSGVELTGWAFDPNTTAPIDVHVYIDGQGSVHRAAGSRPDVIAAFPGRTAGHGFSISVPAAAGARSVCVYAIDSQGGVNTTVGCRSL